MLDSKTNALHEPTSHDEPAKGSSDRGFGIVFTVFFALIGLAPLVSGKPVRIWSVALAGVLLAVALIRPGLLAPLNRLWTKFGLLLHRITNPIIMAAVFFVAVTPTALLMKAFGKDPLHRRFDRGARSYWIERTPPGPDPESMKNQF